MAYKLAIGNIIKVPVHFTINDEGKSVDFDFTLTCKRISQDEMTATMEKGEHLVSTFMERVITGWNGQKLVLDDEGNEAPFTKDALQLMLGITGVPMVFYLAYLKECRAKAKN